LGCPLGNHHLDGLFHHKVSLLSLILRPARIIPTVRPFLCGEPSAANGGCRKTYPAGTPFGNFDIKKKFLFADFLDTFFENLLRIRILLSKKINKSCI